MATLVNKLNPEVKVSIPNMREFRVYYSDNEGVVMFFKRDWEEIKGVIMDYNDKLRLAKEALESGSYDRETIEYIFPELAESEDEKIRKELLALVKQRPAGFPNYKKYIAWLEKQGKHDMGISEATKQELEDRLNKALEKETPESCNEFLDEQGEQKRADKIEPKFKVGDSISKKHNSDINKFGIFTITSIADNKYWYNDSIICDFSDQDLWEFVERQKFKKGDWVFHNTAEFIYMIQTIGRDGYGVISRDGKKSVVYYSAEINYRLWTIQDAKEGDVLACPNDAGDRDVVFIFKNINSDEGWVFCFCASDANGCFCTNNDYVGNSNSTNISPATKEQRDLLFQKMKEAGYEWDAEKKKIKKIEEKPAWSEEDETMITDLSVIVHTYFSKISGIPFKYDLSEDKIRTWLKSLKDRYTWKPSEEQIKALERECMAHSNYDLCRLCEQLKKLREE